MKTDLRRIALAAACALGFLGGARAEVVPAPAPLEAWSGEIQQFSLDSPELGRQVDVLVWLPESYDGKAPRKVLYMHDAQNLFDPPKTWNRQAWRVDSVATVMERRGEIQAPIVVAVYNDSETRMSYLMPEEVARRISPQCTMDFTGPCTLGLLGDEYADFLAETLKPEVDALYATDPSREATSVMGSSMGGLASLYALCRHPETFGGAGALSTHVIGSHSPNEVFPSALAAYLVENLPPASGHRIYFDTGDSTLDTSYLPYFPRFCELFAEMGYGPDSLKTNVYPGASHCEDSWMDRLPVPLEFLLR